jgi:acyl-coenzyme A thioesterase PaaI-like protein
MLDDTMGPAVLVMTEGRSYTTTVSLTVNFLNPAKPGSIIGEAQVTQLGKSIAVRMFRRRPGSIQLALIVTPSRF